MRILLQHMRNKLYFRRRGVWTSNLQAAFDFQHSENAIEFVRLHDLDDVRLSEWRPVWPAENRDALEFSMTKVLLLGLGRWGVNHLRNLHSMPVELYVAEVDAKRLDPARKLGLPEARLTSNYKELVYKVDC